MLLLQHFILFFSLIFAVIFAKVSNSNGASANCPDGTVPGFTNGTCWLLNKNPLNFIEAEEYCQSNKGHLASIHNAFDNLYLAGKFWERIRQLATRFFSVPGFTWSTTPKPGAEECGFPDPVSRIPGPNRNPFFCPGIRDSIFFVKK